MNYYAVERAAKREGASGTLIGISREGEVTYVWKRGDEVRFADERSANAFVRLCAASNLRQYDHMADHFMSLHVVNG